MEVAIVIIAILVVVLGFLALHLWMEERRRRELATFGALHGLQFQAGRDSQTERRHPSFACLRHGDDRYSYNHLEGPWRNREMHAFDYHYETSSTNTKGERSAEHHHFSAVILASPIPLRPLALRREHLLDRMKAVFGYEDIAVESEEFNRRFHVASPDRRWAVAMLHPRAIERLLEAPDFCLEFAEDEVLAWRDTTFRAEEFAVAAELISDLLDGMPEWLAREMQEAPWRS
jgi:hypothetical protein